MRSEQIAPQEGHAHPVSRELLGEAKSALPRSEVLDSPQIAFSELALPEHARWIPDHHDIRLHIVQHDTAGPDEAVFADCHFLDHCRSGTYNGATANPCSTTQHGARRKGDEVTNHGVMFHNSGSIEENAKAHPRTGLYNCTVTDESAVTNSCVLSNNAGRRGQRNKHLPMTFYGCEDFVSDGVFAYRDVCLRPEQFFASQVAIQVSKNGVSMNLRSGRLYRDVARHANPKSAGDVDDLPCMSAGTEEQHRPTDGQGRHAMAPRRA